MGSFIGGILFDGIGGRSTFRYYGIAVLVFCAVHVGLQKWLQRYSSGNGKDESASGNDAIATSDVLLVGKGGVVGVDNRRADSVVG